MSSPSWYMILGIPVVTVVVAVFIIRMVLDRLACLYGLPYQWYIMPDLTRKFSLVNLLWASFQMILIYIFIGGLFSLTQGSYAWFINNKPLAGNLIYGGIIGIVTVAIGRILSFFYSRFVVRGLLLIILVSFCLFTIQRIFFPDLYLALTDTFIREDGQIDSFITFVPLLSICMFLCVEVGIFVKYRNSIPVSGVKEITQSPRDASVYISRQNIDKLFAKRFKAMIDKDGFLSIKWVSNSTSDVILDSMLTYTKLIGKFDLLSSYNGCDKVKAKVQGGFPSEFRYRAKLPTPRFIILNDKEVIVTIPCPYENDDSSSNLAVLLEDQVEEVLYYRGFFDDLWRDSEAFL